MVGIDNPGGAMSSAIVQPIFTRLITKEEADVIKVLLRLGRAATTNEIRADLKENISYSRTYNILKALLSTKDTLYQKTEYVFNGWCHRPTVLWDLYPAARDEFKSLLN